MSPVLDVIRKLMWKKEKMKRCKVCGHQWKSRIDNPLRCNKCKSLFWNKSETNCEVCNRTIISPTIHHIDGNHKNNIGTNLMVVCQSCHNGIHQGIGKNNRRVRNFKSSEDQLKKNCKRDIENIVPKIPNDNRLILLKLKELRRVWLQNKSSPLLN